MPDPSLIGPVLLSPWIFVQKHTRLYALVPTYYLFAMEFSGELVSGHLQLTDSSKRVVRGWSHRGKPHRLR